MNVHVSLTEDLASFVESKVATGSFASMSDVVRESLRLMDRVERAEAEKLVYLRSAWQHGIDSGDAGELDFSALKEEARVRLAASKA